MRTLLAALIPIAASVYAAASTLVEQWRLAEERRIRVKVAKLVRAQSDEVEARARPRADGTPASIVALEENQAFEKRMLSHYGISSAGPALDEYDINISMSGPEMSRHQQRIQWVLIVSAILGVILLAVDATQTGR
ncbi:hypothetical protein [Mycetocola zhujimingii]|uniref:hypothetical protein n=1 Tax=Mycetocola zhujimingii TaxID=2079792 RepID=UPI000D3397A7|nr:hypothetical protein [Mycetocola zhujimingii]AWB85499.1 hypothetical protein C3E77_01875 [Mycetocola zhujimingii]